MMSQRVNMENHRVLTTLFHTLGNFGYNRPYITLILSVTLAVLAIFGALSLHMESDLLNMLPLESELVQDVMITLENFQSFETLYLICTVECDDIVEKRQILEDFADSIEESLPDSPLIKRVRFKREPDQLARFLDFFIPRLSRYFNEDQTLSFIASLQPENIAEAFRKNRLMVLNQSSAEIRDLIIHDPLGLNSEIQDIFARFMAIAEFSGLDSSAEYFFSRQESDLLFMIEPTFPTQDMDKSKALITLIEETISQVRKQWDGEFRPTVKIAGGPAIAVSDEKQIKRDMQITIVTSVLGILLFFQLAFRHWFTSFIVIIPLGMGILYTLGFASITLGRLNMLSSIFAVILVGLGIDFAIHLFHRYLVERQSGLSPNEALSISYNETGRSISAGALTTATAFLMISITEFKGLKELGIIAGSGIIITMCSVFFLLPVFLYFYEKFSLNKILKQEKSAIWLFLEEKIKDHSLFIIVFTTVLTVFILIWFSFSGFITFESDLAYMRPEDSPIWTTQQEIAQKFLWQGEPIMIMVKANSFEEALTEQYHIEPLLSQWYQQGLIGTWLSPAILFPSPDKVKSNQRLLKDIDIESFRKSFDTAAELNGFRSEMFQEARERIVLAISQPGEITVASIRESLGEEIIGMLQHQAKGQTFLMTHCYLSPHVDREKTILRIADSLEKSSVNARLTGMQRIIAEFKRIIQRDFILATFAASISVILILVIYFRNVFFVVVTLIPLTLGVIWTFAVMKLWGLHFNFMNVVVTPMLIGIGIDDGIHIVHHFTRTRIGKKADDEEPLHILKIPGKGILLTSLTTMIGFGSLSVAHYPGLQWIGILTVIGVFFCLLFSVILLPAILYRLK